MVFVAVIGFLGVVAVIVVLGIAAAVIGKNGVLEAVVAVDLLKVAERAIGVLVFVAVIGVLGVVAVTGVLGVVEAIFGNWRFGICSSDGRLGSCRMVGIWRVYICSGNWCF